VRDTVWDEAAPETRLNASTRPAPLTVGGVRVIERRRCRERRLDERALTSLPKLLPALEVASVAATKVSTTELNKFEHDAWPAGSPRVGFGTRANLRQEHGSR
jgi:hypothetical protein